MRRALVIAGVMLAGLIVLVPALATAAPSPRGKELPLEEEEGFEPVEEEVVSFTLLVEGFTVDLSAEGTEGDQTATLSISRDGLTSAYVVPATITDDSVRAAFGSFGRLNFHFAPKKGAHKCLGEVTFTGSFNFTGEGEYVRIDVDGAEGHETGGEFFGCEGEEGWLVEDVGESVRLEALAGAFRHGSGRRVTVDEWHGPSGRRTVEVSVSQTEKKEGVQIARGATLRTAADIFRSNLKAGTATLKPPAPFTGWARMTPGRGAKGIWEGTLQVPSLGGNPIELTGPAFRAHFVKERAFDE